jgi:16S rRNA (cytosine967-C5)-methyltransferase
MPANDSRPRGPRPGNDQRGTRGGRREGGAGRRGRPSESDPRAVAYEVLRAVDERDAYANLVLPQLLRERGLGGRDAALATELTYGTLRGLGTYDAVLDLCSDRPVDRIDPALLDALRLGAHQLLRTRVPAHAAVATTVNLARAHAGEGPSRFANAILRKITSRDLDGWLEIAAPALADDPVGHLSVVHSHPRWIVSSLRDAVGGDLDALDALLAADNAAPGVTLVAKPGQATRDELADAGAVRATWSPYGAYLPSGDPARITAVADGRAAVQDEASQLVALALAAAPLDGAPVGASETPGTWLDMCAGPGGKASMLAGLAGERGSRLLAADSGRNRGGRPRRGGRRRRHRTRLAVRGLRPCAGRRPVHRPGRAAPPPGGALAARPRVGVGAEPDPAAAARLRAGRRAPRRRGRVRHLLAAPRGDPRGRRRHAPRPYGHRGPRRPGHPRVRARRTAGPRPRSVPLVLAAPPPHRRDVLRPAPPHVTGPMSVGGATLGG